MKRSHPCKKEERIVAHVYGMSSQMLRSRKALVQGIEGRQEAKARVVSPFAR